MKADQIKRSRFLFSLLAIIFLFAIVVFKIYYNSIKADPLPPTGTVGNDYFVSPSGLTSNTGSIDSPWSLAKAFSQPVVIRPGDHIWLRGGTYQGGVPSSLTGTNDSPITVRQYPGERAIIDGSGSTNSTLAINGSYSRFWGFELTNSDPNRVSAQSVAQPTDIARKVGVAIYGQHNTLINLVIYDTAGGVYSDSNNNDVYGSIIYNNGWQGPDRGHGHGIYIKNQSGSYKNIKDNIIFNQYGLGIQAYTSDQTLNLYNINLEGNTIFNNGSLSSTNENRYNILLGGDGTALPTTGDTVANNTTYFDPSGIPGSVQENDIGYHNGCNLLQLTDNYMAGGLPLALNSCTNVTMTGNTLFGSTIGTLQSLYPSNIYSTVVPISNQIFVRQNQWEPGRSNLTIYNWESLTNASINGNTLGLISGDTYEIRDVQNYFGSPVVTGIYNGDNIIVPLNNQTISQPIGSAPIPAKHSGTEFGVFVVQKTGSVEENPVTLNMSPDEDTYPGPTFQVSLNPTVNGATHYKWNKVSGIGDVSFGDNSLADTTASFNASDTYQLSLTASDDSGHESIGYITIYVHKFADINNKDGINFIDFTLLLANWGPPLDPMADLNKDGIVSFADFSLLLFKWGS